MYPDPLGKLHNLRPDYLTLHAPIEDNATQVGVFKTDITATIPVTVALSEAYFSFERADDLPFGIAIAEYNQLPEMKLTSRRHVLNKPIAKIALKYCLEGMVWLPDGCELAISDQSGFETFMGIVASHIKDKQNLVNHRRV